MLIMYGYRHLTKKRQKDEEVNVSKTTTKTKDENERRKRKTKTASIEKEQKKLKNVFKTNVSSQNQNVRRWRYSSGYTYLLFGEIVRAGLVRAERAAILHGDLTLPESPIKYRKCPTFDAKRETRNAKHETRNAGDFQSSD